MVWTEVGILAGSVSTLLFVASYLPMLHKAIRSRDLASYSLGNLVIANVGNGVHTIYVLSLPPGPLWALHAFYLGSSALMLLWWWRFHSEPAPVGRTGSTARTRSTSSESNVNLRDLVEGDELLERSLTGRLDPGERMERGSSSGARSTAASGMRPRCGAASSPSACSPTAPSRSPTSPTAGLRHARGETAESCRSTGQRITS